MSDVELKPCPFCGGTVRIQLIDPRLYRPSMNHPFTVVCYACDLLFGYDEDYGGRFDSEADAIEAWNRRADDAQSAQPEERTEKRTGTHACDSISKAMVCEILADIYPTDGEKVVAVKEVDKAYEAIQQLPSAQPEQRYTEEELRVFAHGISLSLLSKRSAQHWRYDKDTATEIKFLERLYDKVVADMRGEQDDKCRQV